MSHGLKADAYSPESEHPEQLTLNRDIVIRALPETERAFEYLSYANRLWKHLPPSEQEEFLRNAVEFVSNAALFRGISQSDYEEIRSTGFFPVRAGQFASEAVFTTNSPYGAFSCQKQGALALLAPERLVLKTPHGIVEISSSLYKQLTDEYLQKYLPMASPTDRIDFFYRVQNQWDVSGPVSPDHPRQRNVELRLPQPISAVSVFLVWRNGEVLEEFVDET